jgi:hypothetical protein
MGDFKSDLKDGEKAQDYILKQIRKEYPNAKIIPNKCSDFDIADLSTGYSAEVKYDIKSKDTSNVGIEFACRGKYSGISKTKATEWIHIYKLADKWVYSRIKTRELKAFIKTNNSELPRVYAGDDYKSVLILIPKEVFADTFNYREITTSR